MSIAPKPEDAQSSPSPRVPLSLGRRLATPALGAAFDLVRSSSLRRGPFDQSRVVVIEPYGMGDVISLEPLLSSLAAASMATTLVTRPSWTSVLPAGLVDHLTVERPWSGTNPLALAGVIQHIRRRLPHRERPAIGIDPRGDIRSCVALAALGCERILSVDHYVGCDVRVMLRGVDLVPDTFQTHRRWEMNLQFTELLGIESVRRPPKADHLLAQDRFAPDSSVRRVALNPLAPWPGKLWPTEHWLSLAQQLSSEGLNPGFLVGPGQKLPRELEGSRFPTSAFTNLEQLAAILHASSIVVSLDSGPMHLAAALGVPVIGLFGTGQLPLWAAGGPGDSISLAPPGGPLAVHQTPDHIDEGLSAMKRIEVKVVFAAVCELLAKSQGGTKTNCLSGSDTSSIPAA